MKKRLIIDDVDVLKSVSNPFRLDLIKRIYIKPKTGQMLADELQLSRAKIHYHLNILASHGIIVIIYEKKIKNTMHKFYAPVAQSLEVDEQILNYVLNPQIKRHESKLMPD